MAILVSPGVDLSVIDESMNPGTGEGTVPFVLIATAQDKTNPDGSEIAEGTTKENAGKLYLVTSQREMLQTFGNPTFQSVGGSQLHGDPTNEYGLLAAYSYMGLANRAYILRADVDLDSLQPTISEPDSPKPAGTIWFDTGTSAFGLFRWNSDVNVEAWESKEVAYTFNGTPDNSLGADGDYAVALVDNSGVSVLDYYINVNNVWTTISGAASTYFAQDLYPVQSGLDSDAFWIKTTEAVNGANYVVSSYNGDTQQWDLKNVPILVSDPDAEDSDIGDFYVQSDQGQSRFTMYRYTGTEWQPFSDYIFQSSEPKDGPAEGAYWYNPDAGLDGNGNSTVDVLINSGVGNWLNVRLPGYDYDPFTLADIGNRSDFYDDGEGDIRLFLQSSNPVDVGQALRNGDMWVDTNELDTYPEMRKWKSSTNSWTLIDNSDQTTNNGILFNDARPGPDYTASFGTSPNPQVLVNNPNGPDLDADRPDPDIYPKGMVLWNSRFSTRNVKAWSDSHFVGLDQFDNDVFEGRWVTASGNNIDGSGKFGSDAQKAIITQAMAEVLVSNEDIRSDALFYNLLAAPGFPEVIDEMVLLNVDRKETAFVIGDSPMTLGANSTEILEWSSNANNAAGNGDDGLITADPYVGVYYPSGLATNVDGSEVVVPPSHMMLRQMGFNDNVAFPWFAPAGLQRGRISNASSVGYVTSEGEFQPVTLNIGQRDVLYTNNINPIAVLPNQGIVAYGQKTRNPFDSSLSRINVARLVNYIRWNADRIAQPFLFEPNDSQTRSNVKDVFDRFLAELVTLRGLYDFLVVCDDSNNTSARIDRNELWIDIAIQPVKSIEFIYIPIRIKSTGSDLSV